MKRFSTLFLAIVALLWVGGCDSFHADNVAPDGPVISINSSVRGTGIVDLSQLYPGIDYSTLQVVDHPTAGQIQRIDNFLLYTPASNSVADQFKIRLGNNDQSKILNGRIIPSSNESDPCNLEPITQLTVKRGSQITLDLLNTKDFCGYNRTSSKGDVGICLQKSSNNLGKDDVSSISLFSAGPDGTSAYAVYTFASTNFVGTYTIDYVVAAGMSNAATIDNYCNDPSVSKYYSKHELTINVIE